MNYFPHDSNARNDERMLALRMTLGAEGYGVYFMLVERLRDSHGYMSACDYDSISFDLRVDTEIIRQVVEDYNLFVLTDDGKFYSESLLRRVERMDKVAEKHRQAGRKGGRPRKVIVTDDNPICTVDTVFDLDKFNTQFDEYTQDLKKPTVTRETICMKCHIDGATLDNHINVFKVECISRMTMHQSRRDLLNHFNDWLRKILEAEKNKLNKPNSYVNKEKRRGIQEVSAKSEDYNDSF